MPDAQTACSSRVVPTGFGGYVKSFGPGLVVVLTWLGAGDLVSAAMAGSEHGYALTWALAVSLLIRFALVNVIAKYHLCNERGETLMAALGRVHRVIPAILGAAVLVFGHFYGAYMIQGVGAYSRLLFGGRGPAWVWSLFWVAAAGVLVFRGGMNRVERLFKGLLALLSLSLLGVALWCRPDLGAIVRGLFLFEIPAAHESGASSGFAPLLVVCALLGAVAGSINNLMYPYFLGAKGWRGPRYRKVQVYDLLLGILVIIILDLAVWVIGAEVLHPQRLTIQEPKDLAQLLVQILGGLSAPIFYVGVFAALFTSIVGSAMGYGLIGQDIVQQLKGRGEPVARPAPEAGKSLPYRLVALWFLLSPLIWLLPGLPGFVPLTMLVNAAVVIVQPLLAGALWYITARPAFIGAAQKNRWWENLMMGGLFLLALVFTWRTVLELKSHLL